VLLKNNFVFFIEEARSVPPSVAIGDMVESLQKQWSFTHWHVVLLGHKYNILL
jgi:hypothetical protein